MAKTLLYIFLGGGFGSISRYLVAKFSINTFGTGYSVGTLLANILASLILGFVAVKTFESEQIWKPMIAVGFCGGFSTYSTFSLELYNHLQNAEYGFVLMHIGLNLILCLVAIGLGMMLGR
ncbi:fluoride efflux transporter FluC [Arcticibacterium luteifluviistationis]|uniref:fluoride efflux transporter FluC n=1 Tax=Arcticibacterium luteifluviistationis TaxID=1784714 RepID=UPI0013A6AC92|nr:CrcB family protein [Arcticibacterium luteifluviistationis]